MISVITITYNAELIITDTILSILRQQECEFEFVLIDGKSSDQTVEIARECVKRNINRRCDVNIISEEDKGIYDAMNKGVAIAKGDFVIFMNAGDRFYDDFVLKHFEDTMSSVEADAYYGNTLMEFYEGEGILHDDEKSTRNPTMPFIHQSVITKRELLIKHPFDLSYKVIADLEFFYWMRKSKKKFWHCDFIVSRYDAKEGISENNPLQIALEHDRLFGLDKRPHYWVRHLKLRCTKGLIQPIKDHAPRWLLNYYFRHSKKYIEWL